MKTTKITAYSLSLLVLLLFLFLLKIFTSVAVDVTAGGGIIILFTISLLIGFYFLEIWFHNFFHELMLEIYLS